jgi:hypothetical protein
MKRMAKAAATVALTLGAAGMFAVPAHAQDGPVGGLLNILGLTAAGDPPPSHHGGGDRDGHGNRNDGDHNGDNNGNDESNNTNRTGDNKLECKPTVNVNVDQDHDKDKNKDKNRDDY